MGESINIWKDPWLSHSEHLRPYGPVPDAHQELKVFDLLMPTSERDIANIDEILPAYKEHILKLRPSKLKALDELVWLKNPSGEYSTRSGYLVATEERVNAAPMYPAATLEWLPNVWNIKTSEKIKVFIWRSLHNGLPVGEQFTIRNIPVSTLCVRCNEEESITHLLFGCSFAFKVWDLAPFIQTINSRNVSSAREGWELVRKIPSLPDRARTRNLSSWCHLVFMEY